MKIADWREEIDEIEDKLISLLNRRAECAVEIGALKRKAGLPIYDPKREDEILDRVVQKNNGPVPDHRLRKIFEELIVQTRTFEDEANHEDSCANP